MAKYFGKIGYGVTEETEPGIYETVITEREYTGDVARNARKLETSDKVNDDINISNEISIVADQFAYQNFHAIRYVEFMGAKWKATYVDVRPPRLILTLGGVYNE